MAVSDHVRELVRSVRARRAECIDSYSNSSLTLADAIRGSRTDPALYDLYLVKLLEANPQLGKVRARRVLSDLGLAQMTVMSDVDDSLLARLEGAVRESSANSGES